MLKTNFVAGLLGLLLLSCPAQALDPSPNVMGDGDPGKGTPKPQAIALDEQARSLFLAGKAYDLTYEGQSYRVFVDVPPDTAPAEGFPLLVMLDGNLTFATGAQAASGGARWKEIAPVVVVGVGYPTIDAAQIFARRVNDLTPTQTTDPRITAMRAPGVTGGEAARFRRFLTSRLPEFVESLTSVNPRCTTLYGHSLGGLFVVDTLLRAPTTYRQYFASSPSLWDDDFTVLKQQPTFAERLARSPDQLRVELSVGGLERSFPERQLRALPYLAKMPDPKMVDATVALGEWLKGYEGPHLRSGYKVMDGETHISVMPGTISRAVTMASECQ